MLGREARACWGLSCTTLRGLPSPSSSTKGREAVRAYS